MSAGAKKKTAKNEITRYYESLYRAFGPQGWWPGKTRFEVIVGAILTQNTAWTNVEKAIANLKAKRLLAPDKLHGLAHERLAGLIRPAGYFNVKAKRLKNFTNYLFKDCGGSLDALFKKKPATLRAELLSVSGIGPETADSIILYAGGLPEFVIDAYTKRIAARHGLAPEGADYDGLKSVFTESLPQNAALFNEYHALIVKTGKAFCKRTNPKCGACPLKDFLG